MASFPWNTAASGTRSTTSALAAKRSGGIFDFEGKKERLTEVERELEDPDVWNDAERAQELGREQARLSEVVATLTRLGAGLADALELLDLAQEEGDEQAGGEVEADVDDYRQRVEQLEFRRMFSGELDDSNAYLDVQSGAGGTEAQDWANMLLRMYLRWAEAHDFRTELIEVSEGEVAGIKSATLHVVGEYAYGWLRSETGIHRLVRKSPFDSGNRRHTSFASIFVSPEVDDNIEVEIDPSDLRIDVYRASGAGGQHVNRTESAVRITHNPTGIVVQCQNDRSQHKNKATAMKQLKAKLFERELLQRQQEAQQAEAGKADVAWGNQIRNYVLDQSRIKDLRTGVESGNTQAVLDGALDPFIEASLKKGL